MTAGYPSKVFHGGLKRDDLKKYGTDILDVSASLNPYPPQVPCTFSLDDLGRYPDDSFSLLKEKIAKIFSRPVDEICVGNGSIELIRVYFSVISGTTCRIDMPTFGEYRMAAELAKKTIVQNNKADIRVLCNPNNPTGELLSRTTLLDILQNTQDENAQLFIDEAFIELAETNESVSDIRSDNLFVLHSLTKAFAVPGLRFGFGFGTPELIEHIEVARTPWTINSFAEKYALGALDHWHELTRSAELITKERNHYFEELKKMGLTCYPSKVNYLTINIEKPASSIVPELLKRGIFVRDCTSFNLPNAIRVAIGTEEENKRVREAITECLH